MKILSRQEVKTGKIFVNLVLTKEEVEKLVAGKIVNSEDEHLSIQIVGYGDESTEG